MRKYLISSLLSLVLLGIANTGSAQTTIQPEWLLSASSYYNGGDMTINDITVLSDGSTVAVGSFAHTIDFDPGQDTFTLVSPSSIDIFIAKYSSAGKLVFAYSFGGTNGLGFEAAYGVAADKNDNIYVTGNFSGTIDFDPGAGTAQSCKTKGVAGYFYNEI